MPASLRSIRQDMKVSRSPRDKGMLLTIKVMASDTGMVMVDGVPMGETRDDPKYDEISHWTNAMERVVETINEFQRQVRAAK